MSVKEKEDAAAAEASRSASSILASGQVDRRGLYGFYARPLVQTFFVGMVCFLCPGLFNALNGLGGGGQVDQTTTSKANTALYSTFSVFAFVGGTLNNTLGSRMTLFLGSLGYALYISSYLVLNIHPGAGAFNVTAGAILGVCAGMLWTAQGSLMLSYPVEGDKGKYVALFWAVFNGGAVIGSAVALGTNYDSESGQVKNSTYIAFLVLTALGTLLPLVLVDPAKMIRTDGSKVKIAPQTGFKQEVLNLFRSLIRDPWIVVLFPFFAASNWFYTYQFNNYNGTLFNIRTRSLNGLCYWLAQIVGSFFIGKLLDISRFSRRSRAWLGWAVLFASTWAVNGGFYAVQKDYTRENTVIANGFVPMDFQDSEYAGRVWLYIFAGALDAAWQTYAYWLMGTMSNDPSKLAFFTGFYKGIQSAFAAIVWSLDANEHSFMSILGSTWGLMAAGLLFATPMIYYRVKEHTTLEDETLTRGHVGE